MLFISYTNWLNEKFVEDSDPIQDLGIGVKDKIEKLISRLTKERGLSTNDFNKDLLAWAAFYNDFIIVKYFLSKGEELNKFGEKDRNPLTFAAVARNIDMGILLIQNGADLEKTKVYAEKYCSTDTQQGLDLIEQKLKSEKINEKFTEDSDPITDMGIGIKNKIEKWLKEMNINNYTLNKDLSIDVNGEVNLESKFKGNLPEYISFRKITNGFFACSNTHMTSLRGCPEKIDKGSTSYHGNFQCSNNNIKSLEYAPKYVSGFFKMEGNSVKFTIEDVQKVCKHVGLDIIL
jgi:hypothetical protein